MVIFKPLFLLILIVSPWIAEASALLKSVPTSSASSSSWYTGQQKGWLWYKRPPLPKFIDETPVGQGNKQDDTKEKTSINGHIYTKRLELLRKNFDELLAKAVLEPTLNNVQAMQQAQNAIMNRASNFERMWMLTSLLSGQNFRLSDQSNPQHRKILQEQLDQQLDQKIKKLAKSHGLFFIFKGDCPYCHEFALVVKELMNLYGFECKAIEGRPSTEGRPLTSVEEKAFPLFPDAEIDNGTIAAINPEGVYPCLFLVNPQERQVIPLARGLVNLSQLRENFKVIIRFLEETPHGQ